MKRRYFIYQKNKHKSLREKLSRKGFTLAELLMVVAIIAILFAVGVPSILAIQKRLRQTELDAKAETIYMAAQNKLSKMKAAGDDLSGITSQTKSVSVWNGSAKGPMDISYITSLNTDDHVNKVMRDGSIESSLVENHWVVEYDPATAVVYAVFYSEEKVDCASDYMGSSADIYADYRDNEEGDARKNRIKAGARVGYYGKGITSGSGKGEKVTIIYPTLTITNAEKLTAEVTCTLPGKVSEDQLVFKVDIEDTEGNKNTAYYSYAADNSAIRKTIGSTADLHEKSIKKPLTGHNYTLDLTLDDLTGSGTRFVNLYGRGSSNTEKLLSGTPIKVTATVMCAGNNKVTDNFSDSVITNSLFADDNSSSSSELNTSYGSTDDAENLTVVSCGRHLQNLDEASGVDSGIQYVRQGADIDFSEVSSRKEAYDWYKTYQKGTSTDYFNGQWVDSNDPSTVSAVPNFKPITNSNLKSFCGSETISSSGLDQEQMYLIKNLRVYTTAQNSDAGLFSALPASMQVKNVTMTGCSVIATGTGSSAGAIAGSAASGETVTTISGCQVYLSADDIGSGSSKKTNEYIWISGKTAGGLIGTVSEGYVQIKRSSCSTVIGSYPESAVTRDTTSEATPKPIQIISSFNANVAGGLIGSLTGEAGAGIEESYADNYLAGTITGGLVGRGSTHLIIDSCYAAGFMSFTDMTNSAGLVRTAAKITKTYSIVRGLYLKDDVSLGIKTSECTTGSMLYFSTTDDVTDDVLAELNKDADIGKEIFVRKTGIDVYKLCGQTNTYDYPVLRLLTQYGDCDDDHEEPFDEKQLNFHFSSDYLKEDGAVWTVPDWTDGFDIQIYNYETDNLFNVSDQDITYTVTVTNGWIQSIGGSTSASYTISKGPEKASHTLHISPVKTTEGGSVTVTVTSISPYSKTLYATFNVVGKRAPDYTIRDQGDGSVLITVKTNNYSGTETVKWDSSRFTPDNANSLLRKFVNSSKGSDGLSTGTIAVEGNSTYSFRFIRIKGSDSVDKDGSGTTITLK